MKIEVDGDYYLDSDVYGLVGSHFGFLTHIPQICASRDVISSIVAHLWGETDGSPTQADAAYSTKNVR